MAEMRYLPVFSCLLVLSAGASGLSGGTALPQAQRALDRVPAWFEPNGGLFAPEVKYYSRGAGYMLALGDRGAAISVPGSRTPIRVSLVGGNSRPALEPLQPLPSRSDYVLGNDPARWKRNVPHFGAVGYREAYPGIDLVYRAAGKLLEYDFVVSPGADPRRIRLRFPGAQRIRLDADGALVLHAGNAELRQPLPVVYQDIEGRRSPVAGRYHLARNGEVRFALGKYDRDLPLVIDPVLVFSGYLGGDTLDAARAVAADQDGNIWIAGASSSLMSHPPQNEPFQFDPKGVQDVFVAKMSAQGTLLYWTHIGGEENDAANDIALDTQGNVHVIGVTLSDDFPMAGFAHQPTFGGDQDGFVLRLNPAESGAASLTYSSYIGGAGRDVGTGIAVNREGGVYVAGYTSSTDILGIGSGSVQAFNRGGWDAFVGWLTPDAPEGQILGHLTFLGGTSTDIAADVTLDSAGRLWLAGYTMSDDFPVAGAAYQFTPRSRGDLFLAQFDFARPGLEGLVYATYLGGSALDVAEVMVPDPEGGLWLAGHTLSEDFPVTPGAYRDRNAGNADCFVLRFDPARPPEQAIAYSTYLGGSSGDVCYALTLAGPGRVALAGYTVSDDFPVRDAPEDNRALRDSADAFLSVLDPTRAGAEGLVFSLYFGAAGMDVATGLAADQAGGLYMVGWSGSQGLKVTDGSSKNTPGGSVSGFVVKVDPNTPAP
jgi:hypothetical protein